jgi:hypothetical protein
MANFENHGLFDGTVETDGFVPVVARNNSPAYRRRLLEASNLMCDVIAGKTDPIFLKEAIQPRGGIIFQALCHQYPGLYPATARETISTNDFTLLTTDTLQRTMLGRFALMSPVYRQLARVDTKLTDFRSVYRNMLNGGNARWSKVAQGAPHTKQTITQDEKSYRPYKYLSGSLPISFEASVNDFMNMFRDIPDYLLEGGVNTIEHFFTSMLVDADGPHASLFTSDNANIINTTNGASTNNPAFGLSGLGDGLKVLRKMRDTNGNPLNLSGKIKLWYVESLHNTVMNVLNQTSVQLLEAGGSSNQQVFTTNWMAKNIEPVMVPFASQIITTGSREDTTWGLMIDPASQPRPAIELGFVRGYENPVLLQRAGNTLRGGSVAEEFGDFDTMAGREFKGITIFGGAYISGQTVVGSNGSGS